MKALRRGDSHGSLTDPTAFGGQTTTQGDSRRQIMPKDLPADQIRQAILPHRVPLGSQDNLRELSCSIPCLRIFLITVCFRT